MPAPAPLRKVGAAAKEHCLPLGLIIGVAAGVIYPAPAAAASRNGMLGIASVVVIFFISGLKLKILEVKEAARDWKSWSFGLLSILLFTPLIGGWLTRALLRISPAELQVGLVLFFIMPCSISSGILISKAAGGSFALSLLMTVVSNVVGVFTVPFLAKWMLPFGDADLQLDVLGLLTKLILTVLLPLVVGKAVAFIPKINALTTRFNVPLTMISNFFLALVPWMKVGVSMEAGVFRSVTADALLIAITWGILIHIVFLIFNALVSLFIIRVPMASVKSVTIVASQKTLPIALAVAAFFPPEAGDVGLIAIPCIVSHLSQIICDSALGSWWKRTKLMPSRYKEFDRAASSASVEMQSVSAELEKDEEAAAPQQEEVDGDEVALNPSK